MVRKSSTAPPSSANLTVEQMKAALPKLDRRIAELEGFDVGTVRRRFDPVPETLAEKMNSTLQEIFGHGTVEYNRYRVSSFDTLGISLGGRNETLQEIHAGYREGIESGLLKLRTIKELFLERISDGMPSSDKPPTRSNIILSNGRKVFVVHGHDEGLKETVARYLTKLKLEPIILHEQANRGRTVIEKFETHSDVAFAVVLFTPDDIGYPKDHPEEFKPRARQNVVLELGFFMASLGRDRVCVVYKSGVEVPSDYAGILYHQIDDAGAWRLLLAREMKEAGLDIDLNNAV